MYQTRVKTETAAFDCRFDTMICLVKATRLASVGVLRADVIMHCIQFGGVRCIESGVHEATFVTHVFDQTFTESLAVSSTAKIESWVAHLKVVGYRACNSVVCIEIKMNICNKHQISVIFNYIY